MPDDAAPGQPPRHDRFPVSRPIGQDPVRMDPALEAEAAQAAANQAKGQVRVSLNLSPETIEVLRDLSRKSGITMNEIVRRSIGLQKFVTAELAAGGKLLVEDASGKMKRVFPR